MLHKDRMLENLPSFYNKESGSNWNMVCDIVGEEYDELFIVLFDILDMHMIDTAEGVHLDGLAEIWNITRRGSEIYHDDADNHEKEEKDDLFRERIKAHIPGFVGGGNKAQLERVLNMHVGVGNYDLEDGYQDYASDQHGNPYLRYGRFSVYVYLTDIALNYQYLVSELERYKAMGVDIDRGGIILRDYIYLSEGDIEDEVGDFGGFGSIGEDEDLWLHRCDITFCDSANQVG